MGACSSLPFPGSLLSDRAGMTTERLGTHTKLEKSSLLCSGAPRPCVLRVKFIFISWCYFYEIVLEPQLNLRLFVFL